MNSKHAFPVSLCTLVVTRARYTLERAHNGAEESVVSQKLVLVLVVVPIYIYYYCISPRACSMALFL